MDFLRLYQLVPVLLLLRFQKTKIAYMVTVSGKLAASDQNYVRKIKYLIHIFYSNQSFIPNAELKWKLLKYEIRKITVKY